MTKQVKNREAGDSNKGFRLQKIRAIHLILDTLERKPKAVFITALEHIEDVYHAEVCDGNQEIYIEEDKNYDTGSNFTLFSKPVLNTLIAFFDVYITHFNKSESLVLGFYTTRNVGKEKKKNLRNNTPLTLPKENILDLLQNVDDLSAELLETIKSVLVDEYNFQYSDEVGNGNLTSLTSMEVDEIKKFLGLIRWNFNQEDEKELKKSVIEKISKSPFYNSNHIGKNEQIFNALMERLDQNQDCKDLVEKMVTHSDVKLIFKEIESQLEDTRLDPSWQHIEQLASSLTDKRNIKDKVSEVVDDIDEKSIGRYSRKATSSKYEEMKGNKDFLSLKYRVFEACEEFLSESSYKQPDNKDELQVVVKSLVDESFTSIEQLSKDYSYGVSNRVSVEELVWNLVDQCYLAFEGEKNE